MHMEVEEEGMEEEDMVADLVGDTGVDTGMVVDLVGDMGVDTGTDTVCIQPEYFFYNLKFHFFA